MHLAVDDPPLRLLLSLLPQHRRRRTGELRAAALSSRGRVGSDEAVVVDLGGGGGLEP